LYLRSLIISLLILLTAVHVSAYELFPCATGNRWEYETVRLQNAQMKVGAAVASTSREVQSGISVYQVIAGPVDGVYDYQELVTLTDSSGKTQTDKTLIKFGLDSKGLYLNSIVNQSSNDSSPVTQEYTPPLFYFSANADKGKPWDVGVFRDKALTEPFKAKSAGRENVIVPAGLFKNCLKLIYSSEGASGTFKISSIPFKPTGGRSINIYWVAEGVGIVKELEVSTSIAEAVSPDGVKLFMEGSSCTVSELKTGFVAQKTNGNSKAKANKSETSQTSL